MTQGMQCRNLVACSSQEARTQNNAVKQGSETTRYEVSKRKIDLQSLVGYIGGYIGICTGLALAQIPEILVTVAACTKRFWKNLNKKQPADEKHLPIKHNQVLVLEEYQINLS